MHVYDLWIHMTYPHNSMMILLCESLKSTWLFRQMTAVPPHGWGGIQQLPFGPSQPNPRGTMCLSFLHSAFSSNMSICGYWMVLRCLKESERVWTSLSYVQSLEPSWSWHRGDVSCIRVAVMLFDNGRTPQELHRIMIATFVQILEWANLCKLIPWIVDTLWILCGVTMCLHNVLEQEFQL